MSQDELGGVYIIAGIVFWFVIAGIPMMQILNKAGYSRFWVLIVLVPIVNIIMLWVFAFARWPAIAAAAPQGFYPGAPPPYPYPPGQPYPPQQYPPQQPQHYAGQYPAQNYPPNQNPR